MCNFGGEVKLSVYVGVFLWGCEIAVAKQTLLMWLSAQWEQLVCGRGKPDSAQRATAVILKHEPQLIGNHFRCTRSCSTTLSVYYQMSLLTSGTERATHHCAAENKLRTMLR